MIRSTRQGNQAQPLINTLKLLALLCLLVVSGYAASKGKPAFLMLIPILISGFTVALNPRLLLLVTLFGGFVVSGITQLYTPQIQLIRWAFAASATALLLHVALQAFKKKYTGFRVDSAIVFWLLAFIVVLISSAIFQGINLKDFLISLKGYLQVWGVIFALAFLPWKLRDMDKFPVFILLIALVQIPFVLHQYFVLVPLRQHINDVQGLVPIDIVSGTFGGKLNHGGANAALSLLCFITGAGLVSLWKNGVLPKFRFGILIMLVMFPAFINSTKVSILYLFIILFIVFSEELITHPLKFLSRLLATLMLCLLIAFSVISSLPESSGVSSLGDLYQQTYNYNVGADTIRDNNLSRTGTINAWLDPVKTHGYKEIIVGYGIGSSRMIESQAGRRISSAISLEESTGVTAIAAIIWETGLIGLLAITMLFLSAFNVATKLKRLHKTPFRRSIFTALQCSVVLLFVSLGHKNFFVYHIGFQTLFVSLFGYLIYWERKSNSRRWINVAAAKQPLV